MVMRFGSSSKSLIRRVVENRAGTFHASVLGASPSSDSADCCPLLLKVVGESI